MLGISYICTQPFFALLSYLVHIRLRSDKLEIQYQRHPIHPTFMRPILKLVLCPGWRTLAVRSWPTLWLGFSFLRWNCPRESDERSELTVRGLVFLSILSWMPLDIPLHIEPHHPRDQFQEGPAILYSLPYFLIQTYTLQIIPGTSQVARNKLKGIDYTHRLIFYPKDTE